MNLLMRIYKRYLEWECRHYDDDLCCCGDVLGTGGSICGHGGCRSMKEYYITGRLEAVPAFWREYWAFYQERYFIGLRTPWFQLDVATGWVWSWTNNGQWMGIRLHCGHPPYWNRETDCWHFNECDSFLTISREVR